MRTMVFDVPATSFGAMSILEEYHRTATGELKPDHEWIFILGLPILPESERVHVFRFPWVKKSWFHRLWFDYVTSPRLVRNLLPDRILSLQNVLIPGVHIPQTLYLHQPMPFVERRYHLWENPRFWAYQNLISHRMYRSIQNADKVIVQTRWMKQACIDLTGVNADKIEIIPPSISIEVKHGFDAAPENYRQFIYPASSYPYKNHRVILEALSILKKRGVGGISVSLTLSGKENSLAARLMREAKSKDLPVEFIGILNRDSVFEHYRNSVLLFPSYIETFGLPLLEARLHGSPIIASDCPFSKEILEGYRRCCFFPPLDAGRLADCMEFVIKYTE